MSAGTRARGVVVLLLTTACPAALTNAAETIPASPVIPSMSTPPLRSPEGTPASLAAPGARLRLVNFWATWCAPCRKEMPELNRFADEYRNRGVVVIGVAADEIEDVRAFVNQLGIRYRILVGDADAALVARFRHQQSQMQPQHTGPWPAMLGNVLPGRKDGKEARGAARNGVEHLHRLRASPGVLHAVHADPFEEEGFPLVVALNHADLLHDVLKAGHRVAVLHHGVQLGAHPGPVRLDLRHPGEVFRIINRWISMHRAVRDDGLDDVLQPVGEAFQQTLRGKCAVAPMVGVDRLEFKTGGDSGGGV